MPWPKAARGPGRLNAAEAALLEDRLLDAAEAVFVEQGYARATMDQIARRGGVGRKTLYARYSNKSDVLAAVVDRLLDSAMAEEPKRAGLGRQQPDRVLDVAFKRLHEACRIP